MHVPEADDVEPVLHHHVEERFPVLRVSRRLLVLAESKARPVGLPGQVEFDPTEREMRSLFGRGDGLEARPVPQRLGQRQRAIDHSAVVTPMDRDHLPLGNDREPLGRKPSPVHGQADQTVVPRPLGAHSIAPFDQGLADPSRGVGGLRDVLVVEDRHSLCPRCSGRQARHDHREEQHLLHGATPPSLRAPCAGSYPTAPLPAGSPPLVRPGMIVA